ncbi:MAG TPA: MBL fold metallo-hydrolase [Armatimonadota bacterium]
MDLLVCGTAAAEGWPAVFCGCRGCLEARRLGGKNLRGRSGYVLGDHIKVDYGPDAGHQMIREGLAFEKLEHLLVTHSHGDHWTPHELFYRHKGFSIVPDRPPLRIHGNAKVRATAEKDLGMDWAPYKMEFSQLKPWQPTELCDGVSVVPILAAHDPAEECLNFLLLQGDRCLLIGHDTGWWADETWEFLKDYKITAVLMDCTNGEIENEKGHLSCSAVVRVRGRLEAMNCLTPDCRFTATHFSHNGHWLHHELEDYFRPYGIQVAYDGLRFAL